MDCNGVELSDAQRASASTILVQQFRACRVNLKVELFSVSKEVTERKNPGNGHQAPHVKVITVLL